MKISYENIQVRLGGKDILTGTTLASREGEIVGIIGANGCGKSTLIKTTFGIVSYHGGTVRVNDRPAKDYSPRELASMIGYVGQDVNCAFDFSVSDVVAMGLYARKDKSNSRQIVAKALEELDISEFADRSIQRLSGGERKMVFIARAIAQGAEMFILDEPTNHLDIRHQLFVMEYLKRTGMTTLIVIHDLRLAAHYCDYLYMLADGGVVAEGKPIDVLSKANIQRVFGIDGHAEILDGGVDFTIFGCNCHNDDVIDRDDIHGDHTDQKERTKEQ